MASGLERLSEHGADGVDVARDARRQVGRLAPLAEGEGEALEVGVDRGAQVVHDEVARAPQPFGRRRRTPPRRAARWRWRARPRRGAGSSRRARPRTRRPPCSRSRRSTTSFRGKGRASSAATTTVVAPSAATSVRQCRRADDRMRRAGPQRPSSGDRASPARAFGGRQRGARRCPGCPGGRWSGSSRGRRCASRRRQRVDRAELDSRALRCARLGDRGHAQSSAEPGPNLSERGRATPGDRSSTVRSAVRSPSGGARRRSCGRVGRWKPIAVTPCSPPS